MTGACPYRMTLEWFETEWAASRLRTLKQRAFDDALTMDDVAEIDYITFKKLGILIPSKPKADKIWVQSEAAVKSEIAQAAMSDIAFRNLLLHINSGNEGAAKDFHAKRVGWSRRRYVVEWVEGLVERELAFEDAAL